MSYYQVSVNNVLSKKFITRKAALKYIDKNEDCWGNDCLNDNIFILFFVSENEFMEEKIFEEDFDIFYA